MSLNPSFRLAAALVVFLAGCGEATAVLDEPEIAQMQLLVEGALVLTVQTSGAVTGPGIRANTTSPVLIEAIFRDAAGAVTAHQSDFEAVFTPTNIAALQFTRSSAHRGSLSGLIAGTTMLTVKLRHVSQGHDDFPPTTVSVLVQ